MNAFAVLSQAAVFWWRNWTTMFTLNLGLILCWLTVVLGPPATLTAYRIAANIAQGEEFDPRGVVANIRRYFLPGWGWALLQLAVAAVITVNLNFYATLGGPVGSLLQGVVLGIAILWLLLQLYALPYLVLQEQPQLFRALRTGLLTLLASPVYTLVAALAVGGIVVVLVRFPYALFFGALMLIVSYGVFAVLERLDTFGQRSS